MRINLRLQQLQLHFMMQHFFLFDILQQAADTFCHLSNTCIQLRNLVIVDLYRIYLKLSFPDSPDILAQAADRSGNPFGKVKGTLQYGNDDKQHDTPNTDDRNHDAVYHLLSDIG